MTNFGDHATVQLHGRKAVVTKDQARALESPITFVVWKWKPRSTYRSIFGPESVIVMRNMLHRHYHRPFRFVCITDDSTGLHGIDTFPLWHDHAEVPNPNGSHNPSCYRRLKMFAPEAKQWFGDRVVSIDLDTVIVGDITPLFDTDVDFKIWGESDFPHTQWMNGSLWMLRTGTRTQVWTKFDPRTSPLKAKKAGARGSDQGWMSYILGKNEATWGRQDGVFSFRKHVQPIGRLPEGARIVNFHGRIDPWSYHVAGVPWVKEHYR